MNAISMKPYRGINHWLTLLTQDTMGYQDPRWVTFKQAGELGGSIRQGEHGTRLIFWKRIPRKDRENPDRETTYPLLRFYTVFNLEQTRGCRVKELPAPEKSGSSTISAAESIIHGMPHPPEISVYQHGNQPPRYLPGRDLVRVPSPERFNNPEFYCNTMFHELTHSTGHPKRLHRFDLDANSGDLHAYGREELTAAMLGTRAGIGNRVLENWRKAINADRSMVIRAATLAQKSTDHILGENPGGEEEKRT